MSKDDGPRFDKGGRAAIIAGRYPLGTRGEVFWTGENKYGQGMRYGLKGDDGVTYWLNDEEIGTEDGAPPAPPPPDRPPLDKGARVRIVGTKDEGVEGEIFWTGASRYGPGMRYGVKEGEATYWVDEANVKPLDEPGAGGATGAEASDGGAEGGGDEPASGGAFQDDVDGPDEPPPAEPMPMDEPAPTDDDLPPEAFDHDVADDTMPL